MAGPIPLLPQRAKRLRAVQFRCWATLIAACLQLGGLLLVLAHGSDAPLLWLPLVTIVPAAVVAICQLRRRWRGAVILDRHGLAVVDPDGRTETSVAWDAITGLAMEHRWRRSELIVHRSSDKPLRLNPARFAQDPGRLRNLIEGWRCAATRSPYLRVETPVWEGPRTLRRLTLAYGALAAVCATAAPMGALALIVAVAASMPAMAMMMPDTQVRDNRGVALERDEVLDATIITRHNRLIAPLVTAFAMTYALGTVLLVQSLLGISPLCQAASGGGGC
jgi:hypothetical protein